MRTAPSWFFRRQTVQTFNFTLVSYTKVSDSSDLLSGVTATLVDTGAAPVNLTLSQAALVDGGTPTDSPVLESVMFLDVLGRDTYRLKFNNNAGTPVVQPSFTEMYHNGSTSSLEGDGDRDRNKLEYHVSCYRNL